MNFKMLSTRCRPFYIGSNVSPFDVIDILRNMSMYFKLYHSSTFKRSGFWDLLWIRTITPQSYWVNITAADALATPWARASVAMVLTQFARNKLGLTRYKDWYR